MKITFLEFRPQSSTGPETTDAFFRSSASGPNGAHYDILKEPHHTKEDMEKAKAFIRRNFDPVGITIITEAE